jgi:hypothetical protein
VLAQICAHSRPLHPASAPETPQSSDLNHWPLGQAGIGTLLLTDDADRLHHISGPKNKVRKTYRAIAGGSFRR